MSGTGNTARNDVALTGNAGIDSLLDGSAWVGAIDYSFPTSATEYGNNYPRNAQNEDFAAVSAEQVLATYFALDANLGSGTAAQVAAQAAFSVEGFTNLDISLTTAANANLRSATSSDANPTAYAYLPAGGFNAAGDIWYGDDFDFTNPIMGNYSWHTHLHEIGHALGLDHMFEGNIAPEAVDHAAYSVMSYRGYEGDVGGGYTYGAFSAPQTYMQLDIAALQHMYGADYTSNSGDTIYTWSPTSSDTVIDGVIALNPGGSKIFATIWDGGGTDTYDLSAYSSNLRLDLSDGGYSVFADAQLADLGDGQSADGSIYNALMFQGNQTSLIENAIGGAGDDFFIGNQADNVLTGGTGENTVSYEKDTAGVTVDLAAQSGSGADAGTDSLIGFVNAIGGSGDDSLTGTAGANNLAGGYGADILIGGAGADLLAGGLAGYVESLPSAILSGSGVYNRAANTGNTNLAAAIDVSGLFITAANADVDDDSVPHVSISATGDSVESGHYYAVTLNVVGTRVIFDIDYGTETATSVPLATDIDSWIELYDPNGNLVAFNDDGSPSQGGEGSNTSLDSYISYTTKDVGVYTIAVGTYNELADIPEGGSYELQISVTEGTPVPDDMSSDVLEGGDGDDYLNGNGGIDYARYTGGVRADYAVTENADGTYTVVAFGTQGTDTLENIEFLRIDGADYALDNAFAFTEGVDNISGTEGDDYMDGLGGSDFIYGLGGSDTIIGGLGNDTLFGGDGDDIFISGGGGDTMDGGDGIDTIDYSGASNRVNVNLATNTFSSNHATGDSAVDIENVIGSGFADRLTGSAGSNVIDGGNANDVLSGFKGDDFVYGGEGNDSLTGGRGEDYIDGGEGSDMLRYISSTEGVSVNLTTGTASGGEAEGDTVLNIERLWGSAHNDNFVGNAENNKIFGRNGDDTLDGAGGIDKIYGGDGADTFVFGAGDDFLYVMDFVDDEDTLDLSQYGYLTVADALANMEQRGNNVVFDDGLGNKMLVRNTDLSDLGDDIDIGGLV